MSKRNLDGTFRNNNAPAKTSKATLLARVVEAEVLKLRLMGFSFSLIATQVTRIGRGEQRALTTTPAGLTFPDNYKISPQGCQQAYRRALDRESKLEAKSFRKLNLIRCETYISILQPAIQSGDRKAIEAALRTIEVEVDLLGLKNTQPELEAPKVKQEPERAEPNGAIVNLFQSAIETLIACGATPRNYEMQIKGGPKTIDVTPKQLEQGDSIDSKKEGAEASHSQPVILKVR